MKLIFVVSFAVLLLLSFVAYKIRPPADPLGRTVLTWTSDDNPTRQGQIDPFNEMFPKDHLVLDPNNADIEKVIVQSIAGVGPDLFSCFTSFELSAYVRAGIAWDITDELPKYGINIDETWKAAHASCMYDGRIYGFPCNVAANGVWYHKDMFDEAHVPYPKGPWTWDQLVELAKKMTLRNAAGKITRYGFIVDWHNEYYQFILQAGGRFYSPDGTKCVMDSPESIAGIQFLYDLVYKHQVMPTFSESESMATQGGWGQGAASLFAGRKGAMALGGRWWLCKFREYKDLHLGVCEGPYGKRRVFRAYGKSTCINKASPNREEALKFFVYQMSPRFNHVINQQADGMGPVIKYDQGPEFLHDPAHPEEDYNQVWIDMMERSEPDEVSPFANGKVVTRLVETHLDLIRGNQETPTEGMKRLTASVNQLIADMVKRDPELRAKYEKLTGKKS